MKTLGWIILLILIVIGAFLVFGNRTSDNTGIDTNIATTTDNSNGSGSNSNGAGGNNNTPGGNSTTTPSGGTATANDIVVTSPKAGDTITSPLTVTGRARGNWYFEASAPVKVTDANGKLLGQSFVQAQGEWMTTDFVPFKGTINFASTTSTTTTGFVVFENDNPSGDPALSKRISIPVKFR